MTLQLPPRDENITYVDEQSVKLSVAPPAPFHERTAQQVLAQFNTDAEFGLSATNASSLLATHGPNILTGQQGVRPWRILLSQFLNALTFVLLIAMVLSFATKDYMEGFVIIFVIILNTVIGFIQEYKAESTMESLRRISAPTGKVIRNGVQTIEPSINIVPGDIIVLEMGDVVPADARLIECLNLEVDEAILTGESLPVAKDIFTINKRNEDVPLGDRVNMTYASTTVTKGRGKAVVVATAMNTEIGNLAQTISASPLVMKTPLQVTLNKLAYLMFACSAVLALIVFAVNKFSFSPEIVTYSVAVAIAVIPEGLIAVITATMAVGVRRMAKQNALVRKLIALESLQAVTDICSDKTGTLTQGKMMLTNVVLPFKENDKQVAYQVTGEGWVPEGELLQNGSHADFSPPIGKVAVCGAICNLAILRPSPTEEGKWIASGDPTEIAIRVFAEKLGMNKHSTSYLLPVSEFPFDSSIKMMSVVAMDESTQQYHVFTKGAPERVADICTKIQTASGEEYIPDKINFMAWVEEQTELMAEQGLRVISFAERSIRPGKSIEGDVSKWERDQVHHDMTFLALAGIRDPPRTESYASVLECAQAGIVVHMLTGDHPKTALSIAKDVGIVTNNSDVIAATKFDAMSDEEIDRMEKLPLVIARCSPNTKVKMINALHRRNQFVVMTGDGVNDAPSLKQADVGIAMGSGSDVAKQASEIVLTDDNFATIVQAVREGRRIFSNTQKFVLHLMSTNVAEVIALIIGLVFSDEQGQSVFPLSPVQILFMNLVTSTPPAIGLGIEPAAPNIMQQPPRTRKYGLFDPELMADIFVYGSIMGALTLVDWVFVIYVFGTGYMGYDCNYQYLEDVCNPVFRARATTFLALTAMILVHAFNCRNNRSPMSFRGNNILFVNVLIGFIITVPTVYIPVVNTQVFKQVSIGWEWGVIVISTIVFVVLSEVYKALKRRFL